ncbi:MAG TPA: hypothetical protein DCR93_11925, partial [Cytophagales bacterium]|nr:hypothetical protein [Cytophagales bacterium]
APVSSILALEFGEPAFYLGGLNNAFWIKADTLLPLHTWSQLVATYANGTARIYLNGALVKEQSGLAGQLNFNPGFHILGQRGDNTRGFAGKLDEVRIFNYALTPQEANGEATRLTFSPTVCLPTAAAQYSFSECSGSTTFDGSGSNDGTLVGASFGTGYDGTGMTFDGNDYVNLGSDASLDFSTGFTFAAWVNTTQANGRRVIAIDNYNGSNWSYAISLLDGQPELGLGTGVTVPFPLRLNTNIADGSWHHLAFTYGQGTVTGYIDGAEVVQWRNLPGAIIPNSGTDVWLGGRSGKNRFFTGSLDEVQLYGQALTAFEISELAGLVQNSTNCPGARPALEAEELVLATSWEVYPNPSEGAITLRAESPFTSETTILITNTLGQVVYSQKLEAGTFEMQIGGLRNAKAGLYLITLVNAEMRQAKTLQIR